MNGIENLAMVGAVLVAMGMLGHGWHLLLEIKKKINGKLISTFVPSRGVAPNVNRWSRAAAAMHSNHNIVESDGLPTTDVIEHLPIWETLSPEDDFNDRVDCLPTEPWPCGYERLGEAGEVVLDRVRTSPCYRPELEDKPPANPHDHTKYFPCGDYTRDVLPPEQAIKHLEQDQIRIIYNAEKAATNITKVLNLLEIMTTDMLGRDKRLAEVEDKLRDAIFILYNGKMPTDE